MKIFVTGGSGFLGRRTVPALVARGHTVVGLARTTEAAEALGRSGAVAVAGDLDDPESIDRAMIGSGCDALVNLASLGRGHAPSIVSAAEDSGIERAVFISTAAIFTSLAPASRAVRLAAEQTIRDSALRWTVLRPTMIYGGPDDRNMARLLRLIRVSPLIPLPAGGTGLHQPVHVDDLAAAVVSAVESSSAEGTTYELAGPAPSEFSEIVAEAAAAMGRNVRTVALPMGVALGAARAYQRVARRPRLTVEQVQRLVEDKSVDITAAVDDLGFSPRPFAAGIRQEAAQLT